MDQQLLAVLIASAIGLIFLGMIRYGRSVRLREEKEAAEFARFQDSINPKQLREIEKEIGKHFKIEEKKEKPRFKGYSPLKSIQLQSDDVMTLCKYWDDQDVHRLMIVTTKIERYTYRILAPFNFMPVDANDEQAAVKTFFESGV